MAKNLKVADIYKCIGCFCCMEACSRQWFRTLSMNHAALRIKTAGGIKNQMLAVVCQACSDAPCVNACPTGALLQRKGGGALYNKKKCTACRRCMKACPVQIIGFDGKLGEIIICKHCGYCVRYCPHNVIVMEEAADVREER